MNNTKAEMLKEIECLKNDVKQAEKRHEKDCQLAEECKQLRQSLESKTELCNELQKRYQLTPPIQMILNELSGMQVPEQVETLKQVNATVLIELRKVSDKYKTAHKFYENNIQTFENSLTRCISGDLVKLPTEHS